MELQAFFDNRTFTLTYILWDPISKNGAVIDSVLDYDPIGSKVWTESMKKLIDFVQEHNINILYLLETHAHADHLSASPFLKKIFPNAKIGIGSRITEVQSVFKEVFSLSELIPNGSQFDVLLKDGDELEVGSLIIKTIHTPGHTPACVCYLVNDALFTGDTIFMPDYGTGRCDFPKGDSGTLYQSIQEKIYSLPNETRIYVGHDYMPNGRNMQYMTTVKDQKELNIQLPVSRTKEDFIHFRTERDKTLAPPVLLYQSIFVNICGGGVPKSSDGAKSYFKLPVNIKDEYGYL